MLRPEVAERFELTSHVNKLHVPRLDQDVDLTQVSLAEAEQLVALPGGFEWLRRKETAPSAAPAALKKAGPPAATGGPAKGKKKKGG